MKKRKKSKASKKDLSNLEKLLGLKFKNINLLHQALTHRSYVHEHKDWPYDHNERLEFLGDAVLEFITSKYLYSTFHLPEGKLTFIRASLVNTKSLANLAKKLHFDKFIYLSKGEKSAFYRSQEHLLANTLEAFIGAFYLDQGLKKVEKFLNKYLLKKANLILKYELYKDPKSTFQELAQSRWRITPSYKLIKESGPPHNKIFTVNVMLKNKVVAQGKGKTKQQAQVKAAKKALASQKKE